MTNFDQNHYLNSMDFHADRARQLRAEAARQMFKGLRNLPSRLVASAMPKHID